MSNDNARPTAVLVFPLGWAVGWLEVVVCAGVATVALAEGVVWTDVLEVLVVVTDVVGSCEVVVVGATEGVTAVAVVGVTAVGLLGLIGLVGFVGFDTDLTQLLVVVTQGCHTG